MRTATIVFAAYLLCLIVAVVWRYMPGFLHDAIPAVGALTAAYLGHTTRPYRVPATAGAVALGYLVDVISGTPAGMSSLVLAATAEIGRATQQRIFVRGAAMTIGYCGFIAVVASVARILVSVIWSMPRPGVALELQQMVLTALVTALVGPLVWRLFRRVDASFARTHRERDARLEGLA